VHQDRLHSLLELAFQVPEILEAVDTTISGDLRCSQDNLARRLNTLEVSLRSWLTTYSLDAMGPAKFRGDLAADNTRRSTFSPDSRHSLFNLTCETLCRICHLLIVECLGQVCGLILHNVSSYPSAAGCATDLRRVMVMLEEAAGTPICKARVMSAPLHFLSEFCKRHEDYAGLWWCHKTKEALQSEAPYLHWDALLPWGLLTLTETPDHDADPYA
jgi:hypothetical protein